jgi:putative transposase
VGIGLYKLECIRRDGPFRAVENLELATLSWVDWYNTHRLHSMIGNIPPIEHENIYYRHNPPAQHPLAGQPSLH